MSELIQAFILGNAAILGNVCMLPLYPGLFVILAQRSKSGARSRANAFLGIFVLIGVLLAMVAIGAIFFLIKAPVATALPVLLPVLYGLVAALGIAIIVGWNPFARFSVGSVPLLRSPSLSAVAYGTVMAPMTLPCTGPLIISAFVLGGVSGTGAFVDGLTYFLAFGLGFGWPLVVLPLLATPFQRQITGWLTRNHRLVQVVSGLILVAVAIIGLINDVLPTLR